LKTIENKITALGPVNMIADDEYMELEERLKFMAEQRDDLLKSIADLEKAISVMTKTSKEKFIETFEMVNQNFSSIFQRLFGGGKAEIRLIEPEDPLESGVDISVKPPGKKLQNIMLLSGGEKALTALSLLFAIFLYKPSPFCFLDEVDAPLDDANIVGLTELLRDFSDRTQFILITHNKKTMEAADVLYGVTMVEPGLSKLVSVQLTN
jgi:chromosome segregation protein